MSTLHTTRPAQLDSAQSAPAVTVKSDARRTRPSLAEMLAKDGYGDYAPSAVKPAAPVQALPVPAWEDLPSLSSFGETKVEAVTDVAEVAQSVHVKRTRINTHDSEVNAIQKVAQVICESDGQVCEFVERYEGKDGVTDYYIVKSATQTDVYYEVAVRGRFSICDCKAGKNGRHCWHRACVAIEQARASAIADFSIDALADVPAHYKLTEVITDMATVDSDVFSPAEIADAMASEAADCAAKADKCPCCGHPLSEIIDQFGPSGVMECRNLKCDGDLLDYNYYDGPQVPIGAYFHGGKFDGIAGVMLAGRA